MVSLTSPSYHLRPREGRRIVQKPEVSSDAPCRLYPLSLVTVAHDTYVEAVR